uniref:Uncharacterized protein n=1 Tax=Picea sitchensis TaxID=3332 RepID=A9NXE2_PICSI|nr:unknown [Picea sitchensis]
MKMHTIWGKQTVPSLRKLVLYQRNRNVLLKLIIKSMEVI